MRTEYLWTKEEKLRKWGKGVWTDEPDVLEWCPAEHDLPCLILRHGHFGVLNGYAGVPPEHPWYRVHEDRLPMVRRPGGLERYIDYSGWRHSAEPEGTIQMGEKAQISEPYKAYWFFGFHTSGADDLMPIVARSFGGDPQLPSFVGSYCHFRYVRDQCEALAKVLHKARFTKKPLRGDGPK